MTLGSHENIINAFFRLASQKDYQKVTMMEIAQEAHLSRQAIYQKHFSSIDQIIEEIHAILYKDIYVTLKDFDPQKEHLNSFIARELLPRIYQHRDWLKVLHSSSLDLHWQEFLYEQFHPILAPYLSELAEDLQLSQAFLADFLIRYYCSIIASWISQDLPMPPQYFAKYFLKLSDIPISHYFKF